MKKKMSMKNEGFSKEQFVGKKDGKLEDKYTIVKEIGSGGFSRCLQVKNKTTGALFACKELEKNSLSDYNGLMFEVNLLMKLDHPNIIKLYEVYENEEYIYLIMELCTGGELFESILEKTEKGKSFTEKEAASLFKQMMDAINYCHKNGIVHRDLKPENLLFLNKNENSPLKLIDFGSSKKFISHQYMKEMVGTPYYMSPEVIQGKYDEKCDIWSAGVILYTIICGHPCFNGFDDNEIYKNIKRGKLTFPSPEWDKISKDAINLIQKMVCSSDKRLNAEQVLNEVWVKFNAPNSSKTNIPINIAPIKKYGNSNRLRKATLTYISSRLAEQEIKKIKEIFQSIDSNNDGKLSVEELRNAISLIGQKNENIEEIFKSMDTDNSGEIEYTEFISASIEKNIYLNEKKLKEAFKSFDLDGNGKINREEIVKILKVTKSSKELDKIMEKNDTNKDGELDFNEFLKMIKDFA